MANYVWAVIDSESKGNAPDIYSSRKKAEPVYIKKLNEIKKNGWRVEELSANSGKYATVYDLEDEEIAELSLEQIAIK